MIIDPLKDGGAEARRRVAKLRGRQRGAQRVDAEVWPIIDAVRRRGDAALIGFTRRFDGVALRRRDIEVSSPKLDLALAGLRPATRRALVTAASRIRRFHRRQLENGYELKEAGLRTSLKLRPLAKVGVYVPGGRAAYPSTVLMNVIPARVAGVGEITVVTPPSPDGVKAEVLAAARLAGADRVFQVGGAQAVAALAHGTATVPRVDKIVGPGNVYVASAKRLVFGQVDIDMVAGPSEVLIIADSSAGADLVAADMLAQAEHDPMAAALLVTTSPLLAAATARELESQLGGLKRKAVARKSLRAFGSIIVVRSLVRAAELSDQIAPEHLELLVRRPRRLLASIENAGAVFLGSWTPESLGDYAAGPNHVLPTGGTARFASPLGVHDFLKRTSIIEATRNGLGRLAATVEELAACEGLEAHGLAVSMRLGRERK